MENQNNNALIAEFMGYETYSFNGQTMVIFNDGNHRMEIDLHYHTDWNWLMEVVEKIESLDYIVKMEYLSCTGYIINKNYTLDNYIEVASVGHILNKCVSNPPTPQNPIFINEFSCPKMALYNLVLRGITKINKNNYGKSR